MWKYFLATKLVTSFVLNNLLTRKKVPFEVGDRAKNNTTTQGKVKKELFGQKKHGEKDQTLSLYLEDHPSYIVKWFITMVFS